MVGAARAAAGTGPSSPLIGVFLLFYGLWYPLKGDLWTYLGVTGTIYLASMSTLLIACCYWKRANNWGAAAAIVVGAVIPVGVPGAGAGPGHGRSGQDHRAVLLGHRRLVLPGWPWSSARC